MTLTPVEKVASTVSVIVALAVVVLVGVQFGPLLGAVVALVLTWVGTAVIFSFGDMFEARKARTSRSGQEPDQFVSPDD